MQKQTYLVPIDFTDVTENALNYAIEMSNDSDNEIILLHIEGEHEVKVAESWLTDLVKKYQGDYEGKISSKIVSGKVAADISEVAKEVNASFIIMGVHGENRFQKLFGSRAVKVISASKTPFIVVQKGTTFKQIKTIAMTIDLDTDSVQVVKTAVELCKFFRSDLVLVGGDHTDSRLKRKVNANMKIALSYLRTHKIDSSVIFLERKEFGEKLLVYCKRNKVDMLAATYYMNTFQLLSDKFVQKLLNNEVGIPVLTIDSESMNRGSQFSFLSV